MQNPFIVGDRIYLRPLDTEDIDYFMTWLNDEELRRYLMRTAPLNRVREREFVENLYKDDREVVLEIVLKEKDQPIGVIGLQRISFVYRRGELGIFIGDKRYWSKGYGTEALELMLDHVFNQINLHRVFLIVLDSNTRAIHTYGKIGFKKEGTFRDHVYRDGKYCDVHVMSILEDEWRDINGTGKNL